MSADFPHAKLRNRRATAKDNPGDSEPSRPVFSPDDLDPDCLLKITGTEIQKRSRSARRSVFVNGEFAFGLSEETFAKFGLYKGSAFTVDQIREVLLAEQIYQAKQSALRMFDKRLRSTSEVRQRLRDRKFAPEAIEAAVMFLNEYNMLNDRQFASSFVNDKLLRKPVGRSKLKMELYGKGIRGEDADEVLARAVSPEQELENATRAARRRSASIRTDDPVKWERSLVNFLQNRGFGWETIRRVITTLKDEKEEQSL